MVVTWIEELLTHEITQQAASLDQELVMEYIFSLLTGHAMEKVSDGNRSQEELKPGS